MDAEEARRTLTEERRRLVDQSGNFNPATRFPNIAKLGGNNPIPEARSELSTAILLSNLQTLNVQPHSISEEMQLT